MAGQIVMTGATSGFGAAALKQIVEESDQPVSVGARQPEAITALYGDRVKALPLDLERLSSVRDFCNAVSGEPISVLAMNAGISSNKMIMTEDGFDRTFQVNYLGHFLIFQSLQPHLTTNAIVATTGSGTHDPEEKTPVPPPRHADIRRLADPSTDPDRDRLAPRAGGRAYTASKLCCILMAATIAKHYPGYRAASFDPGFLPDTNLSREYPKVLAGIVKRIIPHTMANDRTGSIATTAPHYADLLLGRLKPGSNGGYLAMRGGTPIDAEPSELARTTGLSETIWTDTLELLKE